MLTQLDLLHFKCFELLKLPLRPLTLLSGSNASGKSSVLQALVLIQQTMREHEWSTRLMLNGASLRLGTVADVVDQLHGRDTCGISVNDGRSVCDWSFSGDRADMSMLVEKVIVDGKLHDSPASLHWLIPPRASGKISALSTRLRDLTYITAERVGPREVYPLEDRHAAETVGPIGEYAVSVLHQGRDKLVLGTLALKEEALPQTRLHQVIRRMQTFFPGFGLDVQDVPNANSVSLGLRTSKETKYYRPVNVGFGLTQVLPIVVAALSARAGGILLVENPEVHLHPSGQALMGQFMAEVAHAGVQVIVETHSDHVLSGVRRAVKAGTLQAKQVAIHFFQAPSENAVQVISPTIDRAGNIDQWPAGFFDQFDKDASHFAGWGD